MASFVVYASYRTGARAYALLMQPSQVAKLINANVSTAALFAVVFFLYFPVDICRILMTPFDEMPRND